MFIDDIKDFIFKVGVSFDVGLYGIRIEAEESKVGLLRFATPISMSYLVETR
jgi:hypothetical protein